MFVVPVQHIVSRYLVCHSQRGIQEDIRDAVHTGYDVVSCNDIMCLGCPYSDHPIGYPDPDIRFRGSDLQIGGSDFWTTPSDGLIL